jgi:Flp pilus assembly pilin Flp
MQHVKAGLEWVRRQLVVCARQAPVVAQSMVEYAIIAAVVAVVALAAVRGLGGQLTTAFDKIGQIVQSAPDNSGGGSSGTNP